MHAGLGLDRWSLLPLDRNITSFRDPRGGVSACIHACINPHMNSISPHTHTPHTHSHLLAALSERIGKGKRRGHSSRDWVYSSFTLCILYCTGTTPPRAAAWPTALGTNSTTPWCVSEAPHFHAHFIHTCSLISTPLSHSR